MLWKNVEYEAARRFLLDWKYYSKLTVLEKGLAAVVPDEQ